MTLKFVWIWKSQWLWIDNIVSKWKSDIILTLKLIWLDLKITMTLNWQRRINVEVWHWQIQYNASLFILKIQYLLYIFSQYLFKQIDTHIIITSLLKSFCNYFLHSSPTLSGTYLNVHLSSFTTNPVKMDIAWWHLQLESKLESN